MGVVYISYICRSIATVVHCGVMIWAMSLRMEGRGHLLHLPPLCCSHNVWMRSSLQLVTLRQMDNISNKPPPGQPSGVRNCFLYSQCFLYCMSVGLRSSGKSGRDLDDQIVRVLQAPVQELPLQLGFPFFGNLHDDTAEVIVFGFPLGTYWE